MAKPVVKVVDNLVDFIRKIDQLLDATQARNAGISSAQNWYRGVSQSTTHTLSPSLFRIKKERDEDYLETESEMLKDFQRQILLQGPAATGDQAPLLKLFHMQHYGVPTRLLDWSTNPLIALYFALSGDIKLNENPGVWVLDPWAWNRKILADKSWESQGPAESGDRPVESYFPTLEKYDAVALATMGVNPIALLGMYNTERMRAQRGVFTIFGKTNRSMETVYQTEKVQAGALCRIEIKRSKANDIFSRLTSIGYTDSVSYPDFQGVAMEIRRTYGYRV